MVPLSKQPGSLALPTLGFWHEPAFPATDPHESIDIVLLPESCIGRRALPIS